jgi:hypothetical protein
VLTRCMKWWWLKRQDRGERRSESGADFTLLDMPRTRWILILAKGFERGRAGIGPLLGHYLRVTGKVDRPEASEGRDVRRESPRKSAENSLDIDSGQGFRSRYVSYLLDNLPPWFSNVHLRTPFSPSNVQVCPFASNHSATAFSSLSLYRAFPVIISLTITKLR